MSSSYAVSTVPFFVLLFTYAYRSAMASCGGRVKIKDSQTIQINIDVNYLAHTFLVFSIMYALHFRLI